MCLHGMHMLTKCEQIMHFNRLSDATSTILFFACLWKAMFHDNFLLIIFFKKNYFRHYFWCQRWNISNETMHQKMALDCMFQTTQFAANHIHLRKPIIHWKYASLFLFLHVNLVLFTCSLFNDKSSSLKPCLLMSMSRNASNVVRKHTHHDFECLFSISHRPVVLWCKFKGHFLK